MNYEELVAATSTSSATVSGTITAAADSLLLCIVAAELNEDPGSITGPTGWTSVTQGPGVRFVNATRYFMQMGMWWKAVAAAGDVTAEATWVKGTFQPVDTPNRMVMHLVEIGGSTKVDDYAFVNDNGGSNNTGIPQSAADSALAISREGNICVFTVAIEDVAANIAPPTGYSVAAETDMNSRWCLASYYKAQPFSTYTEAQATGQADLSYIFFHVECDLPAVSGSFIGGEF